MRQETPFFFDSDGYRLFGILHEPVGKMIDQGFVFCHPFAEEKLWAHRVFVNFARRLASSGYYVLRFDYMGHGDSEGRFSDTDLNTRLSNIYSAIQWLQSNRSIEAGVGLLGLRFGATLAALTAEKLGVIKQLILWEPVISGAKHMKEMLRINITTQSVVYKEIRKNTQALIEQMKHGECVNIDGYDLCLQLYQQAITIDLLKAPKRFEGKVLVVQLNRREGQGIDRLSPLSNLYSEGEIIEAVEDPFWKEIKRYYAKAPNLYDVTESWLRST